MFFPHEQIVWALSQNLEKPEVFENVYRRLVLDGDHSGSKKSEPDGRRLFKLFLTQDLPPAEEADRIVRHLAHMAEQCEMALSDVCWWDIQSRTRAVRATLRRGDHALGVYFYWKKASSSDQSALSAGDAGCRCTKDPTEPGGCSMKFEARTYQDVRFQFDSWLKHPCFLSCDR